MRALLAAVILTTGAVLDSTLAGTGLALKSCFFFLPASSSSRLERSSRCALSFWATASPGSVKVERVGGLVDFVGTKGALVMEETRGFAGGLVRDVVAGVGWGVVPFDGDIFAVLGRAVEADLVVMDGAAFGVALPLTVGFLEGVLFDLGTFMGESNPSLMYGKASSTFSIASSRASMASTESSMRSCGLRGVLVLKCTTNESSLIPTLS